MEENEISKESKASMEKVQILDFNILDGPLFKPMETVVQAEPILETNNPRKILSWKRRAHGKQNLVDGEEGPSVLEGSRKRKGVEEVSETVKKAKQEIEQNGVRVGLSELSAEAVVQPCRDQ